MTRTLVAEKNHELPKLARSRLAILGWTLAEQLSPADQQNRRPGQNTESIWSGKILGDL